MSFKLNFKRKVGGTLFGNLLRKGANIASEGMLGNGAMKLTAGDSSALINTDNAQRAGAALMAFNGAVPLREGQISPANPNSIALKAGATGQWLKDHWYIPLFLVLSVVGLIVGLKKRKRKF